MYIVNLINGSEVTEIHGYSDKLKSGNIVKGINTIDSFTFSMLMSNTGFYRVHELKTLVTVFNTNKGKYEFYGRVLKATDDMDSKGLFTREVVCESILGFLCDSKQAYVAEQNWTVIGLLEHIINKHNSQVEEYKHFTLGEVTVTDNNDNVYVGIQRDNTWKTIEEKLINTLGGEVQFRVEGDTIYLDYLEKIGITSTTEIALSKNMKSITKEKDPTEFITRLIPLGSRLSDETEERIDIKSVNNGVEYIDDEEAIAEYGVIVDYVLYDDVTDVSNLLSKGQAYLHENNRVKIKYSISALDLSLIGLDIDDYEVHNYHPIKNPILGIEDTARIIKKNINICEETASTIETGDNFKTLSDIQNEQTQMLKSMSSNFATTKQVTSATEKAVANSAALITTAMGGYVVKTNDELLIMDTDNVATAEKVWRWNKDGLAYSSTGYNGGYSLVMTMDGNIVADGIKGGTLLLGGEDNEKGTIDVYDAEGSLIGSINADGVGMKNVNAEVVACNQMSIQGDEAKEVEWVWDENLARWCLCAIGE